MTREGFLKDLEYVDSVASPLFSRRALRIADHDAEQRRVIEDLQKRVEELIDRRNNFHRDVVEWRGIEFDNVCTECSGSGYKVYGNTTTYHHGAGGQAITTSVCNKCWGSGDKSRPWTSWLKIEQQAQQIAALREALQLLHDYQNGCPLPSYEEGWTRAMALTCEALKEHP